MSLSKEVVIDKIEVVENGIIQVRQVTRIMEDGQQLSSSYHRWSVSLLVKTLLTNQQMYKQLLQQHGLQQL